MAATGPIATFGAITAGMTYANGTYPNVPLTGGNGSLAFADITVAGTVVTAVTLHNLSTHQVIDRTGKNYQVADSLSAAPAFDGVGAGSGFAVTVASLAKACENCFYGKIVPATAESDLAGLRYCSNNAFGNNSLSPATFPARAYANAITPDDYFCGDGLDLVALTSFSSGALALPSTAFQGQTGLASSTNGAPSFTVTYNGNLSKFWLFPANQTASAFLLAHGIYYTVGHGASLGTFQIISEDNTNFTGGENFVWLGMP